PAPPQGQRAQNTRDRHARVHAAAPRGLIITQISRDLKLDRKTVRRYAAAADPAGLLSVTLARQAGLLDTHLTWLHQRWEEGCHSTGQLHAELRARGLDTIIARCPELAATRALVRQFGDLLTHRQGDKLPDWASQAEASDVQELRSFAVGLRQDWPAVTAGLTLPWSSGTVEGHVNRIKMIKRQMYGRAKPDPRMRKRVLLAD
ncbi:MAG: transposase, partial [Actinomycetota bacterium]|nr:transposase [Actinomycetota bacterium]